MLIKIIFYPKKVCAEIKNPVVGTFYPIIDIVIMLLAQYYLSDILEVAKLAWTLSVIVHLAYYVLFIFFVILKNFEFTKIASSIYVFLAGAVTATEVSSGMRQPSIVLFTLYLSMISFIVLYPIMLYKIFKKDALSISIKSTAALLASPALLTLISYLIVVSKPNMYLAILSIINIIIVYNVMLKLFVTGFKLLFAAFTFSLTISTLVMYQLHESLIGENSNLVRIFNIIENVELAIPILIIIYVLINLLILFLRIFTPKAAE